MRLTIQFDSQAAKISAAQATSVCSSGWALSQSSQPANSSVIRYSVWFSMRRDVPQGADLNKSAEQSQTERPQTTGSADEFAADRLEQLGAGAVHPLEGDHLPRDDLRTGLAHALQRQLLVRSAARADRFLDDEHLASVRQQVEHGLHHADMGFAAADHELLALAARALEQLAVGRGGELHLFQNGLSLHALAQDRGGRAQALAVLLGEQYRHVDPSRDLLQPGGVLDHAGAVENGRQQALLDVDDQQSGFRGFDTHVGRSLSLWFRV